MHPSCLSEAELLNQCAIRSDRRSGPGGQHRNKVETAIVLTHLPSGLVAEASERRSQVDNRRVAILRLRLTLAEQLRSEPLEHPSTLWLARTNNGRIQVATEHDDFPCLLAELLDHLDSVNYEVPDSAEHFQIASSQLIKLLRQGPRALSLVNEARQSRGMHKLK